MRILKASVSHAALLAGLSLGATCAGAVEVPGVGWEGQGADVAIAQLDGNPRPDMILVAYDNPAGANSFRYKVGFNLDASGQTGNWSGMVQVPGLGFEGQGAGAAVADLDGNGRPELILMAYDNPAGANNFRYTIGWNLNAQGIATNWSSHAQVAGVGWEGQGAAVVIGQVDANPRPDMIFIAYDNPAGANSFRYRVGFNVDTAGNATWSATVGQTAGVGFEGQGAGAALINTDGNPRPDLVLMAYDNPAQANSFRYKIGLNLDTAGQTANWSAMTQLPGVGWEGQGAGLAVTCLDNDPRADWIVMAYDNPPQANSFRYNVLPNQSQAPCPAPVGSGGVAAAPQRKSITSLTAAELASLRKGVAQMIAWNSAPRNSADFRRSLLYWANMHSYFGTNCEDVSGLSQPGMAGVTAQSMQNANETATWCKCEHGTPQFLTWHRMYLYYFERVLQAAAGDPNLRLPFWDYETNGQLPAAYRDLTWVVQGGNQPNPLRVNSRRTNLNDGSGALAANVTSTASAMAQTGYGLFNSLLEGTPHGAVHCATAVQSCPTGYMGAVPAAGLDPIFYSHHANIDRLYECWLRVNPAARLPSSPAILNATFSFVDGDGSVVTRKVADMLTVQQLGYTYAAGGGCPAGFEGVQPASAPSNAPTKSFDAAGPIQLNRGVTTVPVRIDRQVTEAVTSEAPGAPRSLLIIDGLTFDRAPGVLYNVYLQGANGRRVLVGVINFFGRTGMNHSGHGGAANPDQVVLDATEAVQALGPNAAAQPQLVIEPATGIAGSSTEEAVQQVSPQANVRFRSVRIVLQPQ